jgi:hypothetical protein
MYTKEFLIDAFLWRYAEVLLKYTSEKLDAFVKMVTDYYDSVGKDTFRVYTSLDASELKKFRLATGC